MGDSTKQFAMRAAQEARSLDLGLIKRRESIVGQNYYQMTGIRRSEKFVGRKAGKSDDKPRASQNEQAVIWFACAAMEDPERAARVAAFWRPLFDFARLQNGIIIRLRDFWEVEDETNALLSNLRRAVMQANRIEARFLLVQLRQKTDEMLRIVDTIPQVEVNAR
jgi:hypothetical protein